MSQGGSDNTIPRSDKKEPVLSLSERQYRRHRRRPQSYEHVNNSSMATTTAAMLMDTSEEVEESSMVPQTLQVPLWRRFQDFQTHSLRISVSDVAACTGFHPYKNLVQLFLMDHVYQGSGGAALLRHDAALLGISLQSDEERWRELAKLAGKATQSALEAALRAKKDASTMPTVDHAEQLKRNVIQEAKKSKKLDRVQLESLLEGARHSVYTGFGTAWESDALDAYQRQCGWEVRDRNDRLHVWPFERYGDDTVRPMKESYAVMFTKEKRQQHDLRQPICKQQKTGDDVIDLLDVEDDEVDSNSSERIVNGSLSLENRAQNDHASKDNSKDVIMRANPLGSQTLQNSVIPNRGNENNASGCNHSIGNPLLRTTTTKNDRGKDRCNNGGNITMKGNILERQSSLLPSSNGDATIGRMKKINCSTEHVALDAPIAARHPLFMLRGSVDGVRDELMPANNMTKSAHADDDNNTVDDDADSWILNPVVVECKHRMHRLQPSPPLYEMIQATAYCFMYRVQDADLVQVLRKPRQRQQGRPFQRSGQRRDYSKQPSISTTGNGGSILPAIDTQDRKAMSEESTHHYQDTKENNSQHGSTAHFTNSNKRKLPDFFIKKEIIPSRYDKCVDGLGRSNKTDMEMLEGTMPGKKTKEKGQPESSVETTANRESTSTQHEEMCTAGTEAKDDDTRSATESVDLEISVHRIRVDDPMFRHGHHWNSVILPRLRSWVEAVYKLRKDDTKRYQLLVALASSPPADAMMDPIAWKMLLEECPWLNHCDTVHRRDDATNVGTFSHDNAGVQYKLWLYRL